VEESIVRVLSGEAGELEALKVERWRQASPENERTFQEFAHTWNLTGLNDTCEAIPPVPSAKQIVDLVERRKRGATPLPRRPQWPHSGWVWAAAAAAVLAVGARVWMTRDAGVTYSTGPGQTVTVPLADGSFVRLAPNSTLRLHDASQRAVDLDGTAFFAVATDSTDPFVVRTASGSAEVLGTRFEMKADADSLRLVVVEGRVRLAGAGERVEVGRGNVSRIVDGAAPTAPQGVNVWEILDWPEGLLLFQATPFAQVAEEVSTFFDIPFAVDDSVLALRSVTAWFGDEPLEDVVNTVCRVVGAQCTIGEIVEVDR
jgi:transmembrane sensor